MIAGRKALKHADSLRENNLDYRPRFGRTVLVVLPATSTLNFRADRQLGSNL
jgi:hypothetical protein